MNSKQHKTIARHDPAHCLAPGLFRSLKKGKREKLDIKYTHGNALVEFTGPNELGADDLRVLQGLISLAGKRETGTPLLPTTTSEAGKRLREVLNLTGDAIPQASMVASCSFRTLADEIGLAGGGACFRNLRECIKHLYTVTIIVTVGGRDAGYHLLSSYSSDLTTGRLHVALNPAIATAITGGRYVRIDMSEVRALRSDPARLLHQRLCACIDPGKCLHIGLSTICGYIWGNGPVPLTTEKKRRNQVKTALNELVALGWSVMSVAGDKFRVARP